MISLRVVERLILEGRVKEALAAVREVRGLDAPPPGNLPRGSRETFTVTTVNEPLGVYVVVEDASSGAEVYRGWADDERVGLGTAGERIMERREP